MPTLERCLQLIHQADGSIEEKFECASMTYWGNLVPIAPNYTAPLPAENGYIVYPIEAEYQLSGGTDSVNCPNCGCGGGGAIATPAASGGGGIVADSTGAGGYLNIPGLGSIGASASMLLIAAIIGVMIAKKG